MGFLDRLAGVSDSNTFVEVNAFFHGDNTGRVVWQDKKLSPYATKIAPAFFDSNRLLMFDRMYLAAMFYGTMFRLMKSSPENQDYAYKWLVWTADELLQNGQRAESLQTDKLVESSSALLTDHYRTVLYQGRGGNLMNRDYTIKSSQMSGYMAAVLLFSSLGRSVADQEALFFGQWLTGMAEFYKYSSPNNMSSEVPATVKGMNFAVEQVTQQFAHRLNFEVPF